MYEKDILQPILIEIFASPLVLTRYYDREASFMWQNRKQIIILIKSLNEVGIGTMFPVIE
jgi:hypothetical protein